MNVNPVRIARAALRPVYRQLRGLRLLPQLRGMLRDPKLNVSCYPEERRKPKTRIFLDLLIWLMRHHEVNTSYYLYGFDRQCSPRHEDYLAYLEFMHLRNRWNSPWGGWDYRCLLRDKFVFGQFVASLGFSTPRVVALGDGHRISWIGGETESYEECASKRRFDGFYKPLLGENGAGVYPLKIESGGLFLNGKSISPAELSSVIHGPRFLQERVQQHPEISRIYPHSVNTIRLITVLKDDEPAPFAAMIRFGAHGNANDNWSTGGAMGKIDMATGQLGKYFFFKPGYGSKVIAHPDTGVVFENVRIPFSREALDAALQLHRAFYGVHSIGWDIAIGPTGPVFIEGNDNWGIIMFQALEGGMKQNFLATMPRTTGTLPQ
jgi:hypothetical protein